MIGLKPTVFLILLSLAAASWKTFHMGRKRTGFKIAVEEEQTKMGKILASNGIGANVDTITQTLDHFNSADNRTWTQRYFYNNQFCSSNCSVAFLMLGGEGPESIYWVNETRLPYLQWAKSYGAAVFLIEHRFYGESHPLPDLSTTNLKYLTSQQALADAADFTTMMTKKYNLGNPKWIVFGGSYSGALALWMRQQYPSIIAGAVGSSAPVNAKFDYYEYLQVIQNSLMTYDPMCGIRVQQGMQTVISMMNTVEGRANLSSIFKLDPPLEKLQLNYNDIQNFYSTIYDGFCEAVQYSGDNRGDHATGYNIPDVCERMSNASSPLMGLVAVNEYMSTMGGATFVSTPNNYTDMIVAFQNVKFGNDFDSARAWLWQTCNEFAYFQSTDQAQSGIFGPTNPNNLNINMCLDVFGSTFTTNGIQENVAKTNRYYGGSKGYKATNVVMPNGSLDPWNALGKHDSLDPSVIPYVISGTAHCADMYVVADNHLPGLDTVHGIINNNLKLWIQNPVSTATVNTTDIWQLPPTQINQIPSKKTQSPSAHFEEKKTYPPAPSALKKIIMGRPPHGLKVLLDEPLIPDTVKTDFFTQIVDHFDNTNPATFQQQYFVNDQWAQPGGPNFIMLGGEGPESAGWVTKGTLAWLTYAQAYNATVHLLEHRYYGKSVVGKAPSDLKYLSSLQYMYDVVNYIKTYQYNTGNTAPWIAFGGSYSGALALWIRELFPNVIAGSVGSSGPVWAKQDFFEYLQVVEASLRAYDNDCAEAVKSGFETMQQLMLTPEGRVNLSNTFSLTPPWTVDSVVSEVDKQYFFSNIYGNFQGADQYSGDNTGSYATGHGIPDCCAYMTNSSYSPLQRIANFNVYMTKFYNGGQFQGTDNNYTDFIEYVKNAETYGPDDAASLYWTWQTCTEFGYFQSTDYGYGIFGSPTPVNLFNQMCIDIFPNYNFTTNNIEYNVNTANYHYGGKWNYKGTNVIIPNGSVDPWHALGITDSSQVANLDPSVTIIFMNGTAHCADMYPASDNDVPDLKAARPLIQKQIGVILANQGPTTVASTTTVTTTSTPTTTSTGGISLIMTFITLLLAAYL